MPTFDYSLKPTLLKNKYGNLIKQSPSDILQALGTVITVTLGIDGDLMNNLAIFDKDIPQSFECNAIIDTGSESSGIDIGFAEHLQLPIAGDIFISTPSHISHKTSTYYNGSINIKQKNEEVIFEPELLVGSPLEAQGLGIILGRDFLRYCEFYYNGMTSKVKISTPKRKIIT